MNAPNPAFVIAAYVKACHPEETFDVEPFVASAKACAEDLTTGELADADRIAIDLWAHLAKRDVFVYQFRRRGQFWEALMAPVSNAPNAWLRVTDLLGGGWRERYSLRQSLQYPARDRKLSDLLLMDAM